jgi:hypothetical protein
VDNNPVAVDLEMFIGDLKEKKFGRNEPWQ